MSIDKYNIDSDSMVTVHTSVLYHDDCTDGFGAAYAAWHFLGYAGVQYIPVQYGQPIDARVRDTQIYVLDFCYPKEQLIELCSITAESVTILDHHKTAIDMFNAWPIAERPDNLVAVTSTAQSGAILTWNEFSGYASTAPKLLFYIQDRDLWQFRLPQSKEINTAIGLLPKNIESFPLWQTILANPSSPENLAKDGRLLLTQLDRNCTALLKHAMVCYLGPEGSRAIGSMVNAPAMYSSELGNLLAVSSGTYGCTWQVVKDASFYSSMCIQVSLRSIGDYDVESIARYYGGGGHKNASGFRLTLSGFWGLL